MDKAFEKTLYVQEVIDVPSAVILKVEYLGGKQRLHITSTEPHLIYDGGKRLAARITDAVSSINARPV